MTLRGSIAMNHYGSWKHAKVAEGRKESAQSMRGGKQHRPNMRSSA